MAEQGLHLTFPRVTREHLIGNAALQQGAAELGAHLPSGEAKNFVVLAVDRQPGAEFNPQQLKAVSVMTPGNLSSVAEVEVTLSPELNGDSGTVAEELVAKMARIATGNFAHLLVRTCQPEQGKDGNWSVVATQRTVDL